MFSEFFYGKHNYKIWHSGMINTHTQRKSEREGRTKKMDGAESVKVLRRRENW
jgi:hypothetical protein